MAIGTDVSKRSSGIGSKPSDSLPPSDSRNEMHYVTTEQMHDLLEHSPLSRSEAVRLNRLEGALTAYRLALISLGILLVFVLASFTSSKVIPEALGLPTTTVSTLNTPLAPEPKITLYERVFNRCLETNENPSREFIKSCSEAAKPLALVQPPVRPSVKPQMNWAGP